MTRTRENKDEHLAKEWLKQQGHGLIEWQRDDPPDFVVDGKYAVEVRRMNNIIEIDGQKKGEEDLRIPLEEAIKKVLDEFGPPEDGRGWYVSCEFDYSKFSLPKTRIVQRQVREALQSFLEETPELVPYHSFPEIQLECGICLDFFPGSPKSSMFVLNDVSNREGCWVVGETIKNLQHSINEKCAKVAERRCRYPEWWLLFIDRFLYILPQSLSDGEWESVKEGLSSQKTFSRIVVISPEGAKFKSMELVYEADSDSVSIRRNR